MIGARRTAERGEEEGVSVRIAAYSEGGEPEITEASAGAPGAASSKFFALVRDKVREMGGDVPEEAVREVIENLIHSGYEGVVISVLDGGNTVRVSDRGPGIPLKERAFEFGFSGAPQEALKEIRGVGAGLGIARAAARRMGGEVAIEDNMGGGAVVTVSVPTDVGGEEVREDAPEQAREKYPDPVPRMDISERQQKVLITVMECGEVGPSTVAEQLEISVSTAYRDLSSLEGYGLLLTTESGRRAVSPLGRDYVQAVIKNWV